jgi:hypothetical protein
LPHVAGIQPPAVVKPFFSGKEWWAHLQLSHRSFRHRMQRKTKTDRVFISMPKKQNEHWTATNGFMDLHHVLLGIPSGKRLHSYGKIHHFQWVNPLFL